MHADPRLHNTANIYSGYVFLQTFLKKYQYMGPRNPDPARAGMQDQEAFPLALRQYQQYMRLSITGTVTVCIRVLLGVTPNDIGRTGAFQTNRIL